MVRSGLEACDSAVAMRSDRVMRRRIPHAGAAQLAVTVTRDQAAGVLVRAVISPNCAQQWSHVQAVVALTTPEALQVSFESTLRVLTTNGWAPPSSATENGSTTRSSPSAIV